MTQPTPKRPPSPPSSKAKAKRRSKKTPAQRRRSKKTPAAASVPPEPATPPPGAAAGPEKLSAEDVAAVDALGTIRDGAVGAGGLTAAIEALMREARSGVDPDGDSSDAGDGPRGDGARGAPEPTHDELANSLVALCEMALLVSVTVRAHALKISDAPEVAKLQAFNTVERGMLTALAPMAVPFVRWILDKVPALGALGFSVAFIAMVASRNAELERIAAERKAREA